MGKRQNERKKQRDIKTMREGAITVSYMSNRELLIDCQTFFFLSDFIGYERVTSLVIRNGSFRSKKTT